MLDCLKTKYQKLLTKDEVNHCVKVMLQEKFPTKLYVTCLMINIFFGFCAIGFQIALISVKGPLYYVGAGIWIGALMITCELVGLSIIRYRRIRVFNLTQVWRFFTGLATIPLGTIGTTQVMAINKLIEENNCIGDCYGSQYLWIHWVLFSVATAYGFPHACLAITFYRLKAETYKEFYVNNYMEKKTSLETPKESFILPVQPAEQHF